MEILIGLNLLKINNGVRTFIEKEVHYGQIGFEAILGRKNLPVWLFQIQQFKYVVGTFRMNDAAEVLPVAPVIT